MPPQKRVKSVVTCTSKRWMQEKSTPVLPKKGKKSAGDRGMQGRPELQITVPADRPQGQPSPVQLHPHSPWHCNQMVQCRGQWPGHHYQGQSPLPQLHGNNQHLNISVGNNHLISYHLGWHHGTPVLGLTTSSTNQHLLQCTTPYHGWQLDWCSQGGNLHHHTSNNKCFHQQPCNHKLQLNPPQVCRTNSRWINQYLYNRVPLTPHRQLQMQSNSRNNWQNRTCHQSHLGFYHSCNITTCPVSI